MRRRLRPLSRLWGALLATGLACGKSSENFETIERAPAQGSASARAFEGTWNEPSMLWVESGQVAILDGETPRQRIAESDFEVMPVGTLQAPATLGEVRAIARREGGGVWMVSTNGLFHSRDDALLRSPLSEQLDLSAVRFLDATGVGADETLWLTFADESVRRLQGGRLGALELRGPKETGALQGVLGLSTSSALALRGETLSRLDLGSSGVQQLATGLGTLRASGRLSDGTLLLATSTGLWTVASGGKVTRHTLAAPGQPARSVDALWTQGQLAILAAGGEVLQWEDGQATVVSQVENPQPLGLALDGDGQLWLVDGISLVRVSLPALGPPPSFAQDVRPFFEAHCVSCHASGASYAPVIDWTDLATVRARSAAAIRRLTDADAPMPPASQETLSSADYGVVVRWVNGGMQP